MKFDLLEHEIDLIKTKNDLSSLTILEIGCGTGRLTSLLSKTAKHVIAIEPSSEIIEENRRLYADIENIQFETASIIDLPFDDNSFDLVIFSLSLCCVEPVDQMTNAVIESVRVLKSGGQLINIMPSTVRKFSQGYYWYYIDENSMNQVFDMDVCMARMALKQVCYIEKLMKFIEEGNIPTKWQFDSLEELREKWLQRYNDNVQNPSTEHKNRFLSNLDDFLSQYSLVFEIDEEYQLFEKL